MIIFVEESAEKQPNASRNTVAELIQQVALSYNFRGVLNLSPTEVDSSLDSLIKAPGGHSIEHGRIPSFVSTVLFNLKSHNLNYEECRISISESPKLLRINISVPRNSLPSKAPESIFPDYEFSSNNIKIDQSDLNIITFYTEQRKDQFNLHASKVEQDFQIFNEIADNLNSALNSLELPNSLCDKLSELLRYAETLLRKRTVYYLKENQVPIISALAEAPLDLLSSPRFLSRYLLPSDDINFDSNGRIRSDDSLGSYLHNRYWDRDLPLREVAVKIAGAKLRHEYLNDLIQLLDQSFMAENGLPASDHYSKLRHNIIEALRLLAVDSNVSRNSIVNFLIEERQTPWWKQCALISALSSVASNPEIENFLIEIAKSNSDLALKTSMSSTSSVKRDQSFIDNILRVSAIESLARGGSEHAPILAASLISDFDFLERNGAGHKEVLNRLFNAVIDIGTPDAISAVSICMTNHRIDSDVRAKTLDRLTKDYPNSDTVINLVECLRKNQTLSETLGQITLHNINSPLGAAAKYHLDILGSNDRSKERIIYSGELAVDWGRTRWIISTAGEKTLIQYAHSHINSKDQSWSELAQILGRLLDIDTEEHLSLVDNVISGKKDSLSGYWTSTAYMNDEEFGAIISQLYLSDRLTNKEFLTKSVIQTENLGNSKLPGLARHVVAYSLESIIKEGVKITYSDSQRE